jgi:hypothetical protein
MEILWDHLTPTEWQSRLDASGHWGMRQAWGYGAAMQRYGAHVARALIIEEGRALALAQLVQRRRLRLISQGPVWLEILDAAQKARILRHLARRIGATVATPDAPLAGWGMMPLITAKTHAIWRIDRPQADLRKALHGKWRNRLLRAEEEVRPSLLKDDKSLEYLIAQEAAQRAHRGYRNLPGKMAVQWQGGRLVIGWRKAGAVQAGMVFLVHGVSASYHLGWASPLARAGFAHGPMLWQAALALRRLGVRWLDLGEVNTQSGASLARFKLGTGAEAMPLGATCLVLPFP